MTQYRYLIPLAGFLLLFGFTGCSGKLVPVSGRVTYSDNGEALETGIVAFASEKAFARGSIRENGQYTLGSFTENDGVPPGTYAVYIEAKKEIAAANPDADDSEYQQLIAVMYSRPETSGLTCTVKKSKTKFDIQVERHPQTANNNETR